MVEINLTAQKNFIRQIKNLADVANDKLHRIHACDELFDGIDEAYRQQRRAEFVEEYRKAVYDLQEFVSSLGSTAKHAYDVQVSADGKMEMKP
jgi:hypothetical protein